MSSILENFGKYTLLERLAAGGMAEVFLAKSNGASGIGKFLAIKRILPQHSDSLEFIDMFKEEAKIAVNLNHGNVVSIYEFGMEKNQFYLVMEFVEGQNLRQVLNHLKKEAKYFSLEQITYIVKEVAAGLDHAHRCLDSSTGRPLNITHRDMSPQNIMVSFEGEVKVVDFGIAKAESQLEHTRAGTIKGKFGYMSPEQADGQVVDLRTDIFSLGIILWELLAGERLFTAGSEAATLRKIRDCQIPSLRKINPQVPAELEKIVNKALARDKNMRYQTASAFHKDLNRFLNTDYPDFSVHDFSIFMKSTFSTMFLENKKKLAEYSKIQVVPDDKTSITKTTTGTYKDHLAVGLIEFEAGVSDEKDVAATAEAAKKAIPIPLVKLEEKKIEGKSPAKTPTSQQEQRSHRPVPPNKFNQTPEYRTRTNYTIQTKKSSFSASSFLMLSFVALVGFYFWNKHIKGSEQNPLLDPLKKITQSTSPNDNPAQPVATTDPVTKQDSVSGQIDSASLQKVIVNINSQPSGARLYINGEDTGMFTPTRRQVEANTELRIALRKEGYLYYERTEKVTESGASIMGTLQKEPEMGYLYITVAGGGSDSIISINGQRLTEKPPIQKYAVPAGSKIVVEAFSPFLKLKDTQTIVVGVNQKKSVQLILGRTATPNR